MDEVNQPLQYEETPVIEPVTQEPLTTSPEVIPSSPQSRRTHSSLGSTVVMIFFFIILFALGVGLSVMLRQYFASRTEAPPQSTTTKPTPTRVPSSDINALQPPVRSPTAAIVDPYAGWKTYQVISGVTKQPVPGVSFKLPSESLAPICDGVQCASQGTYLSNGSRFTVAARGKGQLLADARGNVLVTDWSGKSFTTKAVTLAGGRKALEYSGLFSGTTVGGYTFSQMRGLMMEIDEVETLEMNHFTPSGVSAEFAKDDVLFDKIVASLAVARFPQTTLTASPTP
ncbi:hypothetical protein HY411_00805 [Candidatus Gottesmanbacteria bacterium]|nr:hypothetical protein [Candidatus Gottesmanbacteria bacterium]